jgi:hypothetical protein
MSNKIKTSDFFYLLSNEYDIQGMAKISKEHEYIIYVNSFCEDFDSYVTFVKDHMDFIEIFNDHEGFNNHEGFGDTGCKEIDIHHKKNCLIVKVSDIEGDHGGKIGCEFYIYNVNKKEIKQLTNELNKYNQ